MRTFWLSFCDPDRPKGRRFLGVCVVDVTDADIEAARTIARVKFPLAGEGADFIGGAMVAATRLGCNPGGEIAYTDVTDCEELYRAYPRGVLMDRAAIDLFLIRAAQPETGAKP